MNHKICSKCKIEKELSEFNANKLAKDGFQFSCRVCQKEWRKNNRAYFVKYNKKHYEENKEKDKAASRAWHKAHKKEANAKRKINREENLERDIQRQKQWREDNREKITADKKIQYEQNKEKIKLRAKRWNENNPEKATKRRRQYYINNKEKMSQKSKSWKQNNKGKVQASVRKRTLAKIYRTPIWINDFLIEEIYELCQLRTEAVGVKHEVDHIIPLQGKLVSGLHVHDNLQILTAFENLTKSNKFDIEAHYGT